MCSASSCAYLLIVRGSFLFFSISKTQHLNLTSLRIKSIAQRLPGELCISGVDEERPFLCSLMGGVEERNDKRGQFHRYGKTMGRKERLEAM
jgi:hypothetical protein